MLGQLFKDLGTRLSKENDLSDLTWALAKNCDDFMLAVMELFDFDEFKVNEPWDIYREFDLGKYREKRQQPDFAVINKDKLFIIENKIYNRDYHYDYVGALKNFEEYNVKKYGIIVNHEIKNPQRKKLDKYHVIYRKWEDFIALLEVKRKEEKFDEETAKILNAYIQYVKEVCALKPIEKITFDENSLKSLYYFTNLVEKIINSTEGCDIYKTTRARCDFTWSGYYYSLKKKSSQKTLYPWFGIVYNENDVIISVYLDFDWNEEVVKDLEKYVDKNINLFNVKKYDDGSGGIIFEILPNNSYYLNDFYRLDKNKQKSLLQGYFREVNKILEEQQFWMSS